MPRFASLRFEHSFGCVGLRSTVFSSRGARSRGGIPERHQPRCLASLRRFWVDAWVFGRRSFRLAGHEVAAGFRNVTNLGASLRFGGFGSMRGSSVFGLLVSRGTKSRRDSGRHQLRLVCTTGGPSTVDRGPATVARPSSSATSRVRSTRRATAFRCRWWLWWGRGLGRHSCRRRERTADRGSTR